MGTSELRCERRGVPLTDLRFERRDAGDDIVLQNATKSGKMLRCAVVCK